MLQRIIGVSLGALVAYLLLILMTQQTGTDQQGYVTALVVGALVSFFWPIVIGWYLVRRRKAKNADQMNAEVNRQVQEELAKQQQQQ